MNNPQGILFDFNGVLLWDSHLHDAAWEIYSEKLRGTALSADEMYQRVHGRTNKDILEYLLDETVEGEDLLKHIDGKESIYRQMCLDQPNEFKLAPGVIEYLNYLKDKDVPRTIATASEIGNLKLYFEHLNLVEWFDFDLVAYDDGTINGKPAPDIYLKATQNLQLDPSICTVIEDSKSGIASAHNAKVGSIIALGPKDTHESLLSLPGVTQAIVDLHELLPKR